MANNKVVLEISNIHSSPSSPWKRTVTISTSNSIDNADNYQQHTYDDNPDYAESDDLEIPLKLIMHNIKTLFQGDINLVVKSEDDRK